MIGEEKANVKRREFNLWWFVVHASQRCFEPNAGKMPAPRAACDSMPETAKLWDCALPGRARRS